MSFTPFSLLISTLKGYLIILQETSRSNERNRLVYEFNLMWRGEDSLSGFSLSDGRYGKCENALTLM